AIARLLADEVAVQPPDPALDTRIIDALLGASALETDSELAEHAAEAVSSRMMAAVAELDAMAPPPPPGAPPKPQKKRAERAKLAKDSFGADDLDADLARRRQEAPMYRVVDRTQEWAENNWRHRTPEQSGPDMIAPNRLWRDFAQHRGEAFL